MLGAVRLQGGGRLVQPLTSQGIEGIAMLPNKGKLEASLVLFQERMNLSAGWPSEPFNHEKVVV